MIQLVTADKWDSLLLSGYRPLDRCPEIIAACDSIAQLIASMTIYQFENTEKGDVRIKDGISRLVDIEPNHYMTRATWINAVVMNMLLYGRGNSVVIPHTKHGYLEELEPVQASRVGFIADGYKYKITIDGIPYSRNQLLHFVFRPDKNQLWKGKGIQIEAAEVAQNLAQASETVKGFMGSQYKPSLVIKVDTMSEEMSSKEGRSELLRQYVENSDAGRPWLIPSDTFEIEQIRPLSINDLAIPDMVKLDKETVSSILHVPPFLLGVGKFDKQEWNNFIATTVQYIAKIIEQELTRGILISPNRYFAFNIRSLYRYDLSETANVYKELRSIGVVSGNEVRDAIGLSPREGLDELVMLENYIPIEKLAQQKKLLQGGDENE